MVEVVRDPCRFGDVQPSPRHRLLHEPTAVPCFLALTDRTALGPSCLLVSGRILPATIGLTAILVLAG
ncbi:MAG: hypothetical protein GF399_11245 [Candidatus Coatesbacteria bacterium]|nr:hypothetical protein [Candidatus Coatesbacteria bacterium]